MFAEAHSVFAVILPDLLLPAVQTFGLCIGIIIVYRSAGFLNLASGPLALAGAGAMASSHLIFGTNYAGSILVFVILCAVLSIWARIMESTLVKDNPKNLDVCTALRRSLLSLAAALTIVALANEYRDQLKLLTVPIGERGSDTSWDLVSIYSKYWVILASVFATLLAALICLVFWQDEIARSRKRSAMIIGLACTMFSGAAPVLAGHVSPDASVGSHNSIAALTLVMSLGSRSLLNLGLAALAWAILLYLSKVLGLAPYLPAALLGVFGLVSANAAARTLGTKPATAPAQRWVDLTLFVAVLGATPLMARPELGMPSEQTFVTLPLAVLGLNFFRLQRDRICLCGPLFCCLGAAITYTQTSFYGVPAPLVIIMGGILAGAAYFFLFGKLSEMNSLAATLVLSYVGSSAIYELVGGDGLPLQGDAFDQSQLAPISVSCLAALGLLFWVLQAKIQKAAYSSGLDLCSFILGSVSLVLAGALSAWDLSFLAPDQFSIERGPLLTGLALVAGRSSVAGAIVSPILWTFLVAYFAPHPAITDLLPAAVLVIGVGLFPHGVLLFGRRQTPAGQANSSGLQNVSA